ncbi:MAG: hypothetical protein ACOYYS_11300 [Chloroflexota bacterium]
MFIAVESIIAQNNISIETDIMSKENTDFPFHDYFLFTARAAQRLHKPPPGVARQDASQSPTLLLTRRAPR